MRPDQALAYERLVNQVNSPRAKNRIGSLAESWFGDSENMDGFSRRIQGRTGATLEMKTEEETMPLRHDEQSDNKFRLEKT